MGNGEVTMRHPGDEDIVRYGDVRGLIQSGKLEIVDDSDNVPTLEG